MGGKFLWWGRKYPPGAGKATPGGSGVVTGPYGLRGLLLGSDQALNFCYLSIGRCDPLR